MHAGDDERRTLVREQVRRARGNPLRVERYSLGERRELVLRLRIKLAEQRRSEAEDVAGAGGRRVVARPLHEVGAIDRRGVYAHEYFAGCGVRAGAR